jgi:hypothetical protein
MGYMWCDLIDYDLLALPSDKDKHYRLARHENNTHSFETLDRHASLSPSLDPGITLPCTILPPMIWSFAKGEKRLNYCHALKQKKTERERMKWCLFFSLRLNFAENNREYCINMADGILGSNHGRNGEGLMRSALLVLNWRTFPSFDQTKGGLALARSAGLGKGRESCNRRACSHRW